MKQALEQITKTGCDPKRDAYIVDVDSSTYRSTWVKDRSPCITRSRARGHWITNKHRYLTLPEMMRLQGMDHSKFNQVVTDRQMGQQIGNSMSVNVIERVLIKVLLSSGLAQNLKYRWESGQGLQMLKNLRGSSFLYQKPKTDKNEGDENIAGGDSCPLHKRPEWPREFLVDSGASFHLVGYETLTTAEKKTLTRREQPMPLTTTANGSVIAKNNAQVYAFAS